MVLARRGTRHRDSLLSRASAARTARARLHAGSGRGHARMVHAHPAPRGGPRDRQRVQAAPAPPPAADLRAVIQGLSTVLRSEAVQQELRPAPGQLVRAEPSRRGPVSYTHLTLPTSDLV